MNKMKPFTKEKKCIIYWAFIQNCFDLCKEGKFTKEAEAKFDRILKKLW